MNDARSPLVRAAITAIAALAIVATLSGCRPEPSPTATSSTSRAPSPTASTSGTASPSPTPSEGGQALALPASCEAIYTPEMLATLTADVPPLNDPGTTLASTENVEALEVLESGVPTIRCSWGPPSERGLATNVTIVSPEQSAALAAAFTSSGFGATDLDGGTLYEIQRETVTQDDEIVTLGEAHFLRGDGWVSTRWINVNPDGYTPSIVEALWG